MPLVRREHRPEEPRTLGDCKASPARTEARLRLAYTLPDGAARRRRRGPVPFERACAGKDSHRSPGLVEQRGGLERRLSCTNDRHVAPDECLGIADPRTVQAKRLGQSGELIRDVAERHVSGRENDLAGFEDTAARELERECPANAPDAPHFVALKFSDGRPPEPFGVFEKADEA